MYMAQTMNLGSFNYLPYDVFELLLHMLNGREVMAVCCVCKSWHDMCQIFMRHRKADHYWKNRCLQDIDWTLLHGCMSGGLTENWYQVYKSSVLSQCLSRRITEYCQLQLNERFIRSPTHVHLIGSYLVVIQSQLISVYDCETAVPLCNLFSKYIVYESYIKKKKLSTRVGLEDDDCLACDILVLFCGSVMLSHVAVFTAQTLLSGQINYSVIPHNEFSTKFSPKRRLTCTESYSHFYMNTDTCFALDITKSSVSIAQVSCHGTHSSNNGLLKADCEALDNETNSPLSYQLTCSLVCDVIRDDIGDRLRIYNRDNQKESTAAWLEGTCLAKDSNGFDVKFLHCEDRKSVFIVAAVLQQTEALQKHVTLYWIKHSTE